MATLHRTLTVGKTYVVTSANGCTVTLANGVEVTLQAGQDYFTPDTPDVTVSDDTATVVQTFNHAPARRGGGGSVTIDPAPTQGSPNAVRSGGVYTALRELPAPTPETLEDDTAMKHGGVYTVAAAGTALDYSDVTLAADYASAEIWVTCTATTTVTWPDSWSWVDGVVPPCQAGNRYFVRVWSDGHAVIAELKYSYANA